MFYIEAQVSQWRIMDMHTHTHTRGGTRKESDEVLQLTVPVFIRQSKFLPLC